MGSKWIVVGIGGATCSGKTTIANELHKRIPNSVVIHQDDYFLPIGSPQLEYLEEFKHYNWDKLWAIDSDKLISAVQSTVQYVTL